MSFYEHTFIATPDCNKKDLEVIEKKIVDILASNSGKILKKEDWGIRNLAYPIKKNVKGIYKNLYFETDGKAVKEIEYFERYNDKIIKFLSIKLKNIPKEDSQLKKI